MIWRTFLKELNTLMIIGLPLVGHSVSPLKTAKS